MNTAGHPLSKQIRRGVLEQSKRANVGHIGSALSIADLLASIMEVLPRTTGPERDRFILSKGHAALALYVALHATGRLSDEDLASFCADNSPLATHPEHVIAGIDFSTGSLGQGLSYAVGSAFAARLQRSQRRAFVLMSDAECDEGAVWEAVMFAAHHRLGNLIAIVDVNGQQAFGYTRDVLDLAPLGAKWEAFGWHVHELDGHDVDALTDAMRDIPGVGSKPQVILARTTFGRGVSYMENTIAWHYMPMNDQQYATALSELGDRS